MTDSREALRSSLDSGLPAAPFDAVEHALTWAVDALQQVGVQPNGTPVDTAALEALIRLDDALSGVHDLRSQAVRVAQLASAGSAVDERILGAVRELRRVGDDVAAMRHESEALARVETELVAARREHDELTERMIELRRLEQLADGLPTLREQHGALTRRLAAMAAPVAEAEQALLATAGQVVTLGEELRERLDKRTQEMLLQVEAVEQARKAESREQAALAEKTAAYAQLQHERDQRLRSLEEYRRIDADLAQRLTAAAEGRSVEPTARGVGLLLDDVEKKLREIDDGLRDAMERYNRVVTEDLKERPWLDDPA